MINKLMTTILAVGLSANAMAATATGAVNTSSTEGKSLLQELRDSPASLAVITYTYTSRDDLNRVNGVGNDILLSSGYRLENGVTLGMHNWASKAIIQDEDTEASYDLTEFKVSKFGLFPDNALGLSLGAQLRVSITGNEDTRLAAGTSGNAQVRIYATKPVTDSFAVDTTLRLQQYERATAKSNLDKRLNIYVTPKYTFNDKWSVEHLFYFQHTVGDEDLGNGRRTATKLLINPAVNYNVTEHFGLTAYMEAVPFRSHDSKTVTEDFIDGATYGLAMSLSAF